MKPYFPVFGLFLVALGAPAIGLAQPPAQRAYAVPKPDGGIVTLFEDDADPLIPLLKNTGGGEAGTATREDRDVYSGLSALRVAQVQKYEPQLPGWSFKIVEAPTAADEFRYLRLAWKKVGGTGIMLQLHDADTGWSLRYVAGPNSVGWESKTVSPKAPADWTVVTRDLYEDFRARRITGIAFTAMDGSHALFDHISLGRTIADLDRSSSEILGTAPLRLSAEEFQVHWKALLGHDAQAGPAIRALLRGSRDASTHLKAIMIGEPTADEKAATARIRARIAELDDVKFDTREAASRALEAMGAPAKAELMIAIRTHASAEVVYRCGELLKALGAKPGFLAADELRTLRAVRVLERAGTPDARTLLEAIARGGFGSAAADAAGAALARQPPRQP